MTTAKKRNTNLEILRIIAMFFIIAHHFAVHGMGGVNFVASNPNNYLIYFAGILGKIGVVVFILISSYFMVNSRFTFRKFMFIAGEVWFYSLLFLILFLTVLTPAIELNISNIGIHLLAISHSAYWFVTDYIILMVLSPYLNIIIKKISKEVYVKLLLVLLVIWSVFPTFTPTFMESPVATMFTGYSFQYVPIIWFVVLYFIGGFIRLHLDLDKISFKTLYTVFGVSMIITYIASCIIGYYDIVIPSEGNLQMWIGFPIEGLFDSGLYMWPALENKLFLSAASISLFLIFLKRKEFSNKYINYIAGSAFGVYLIHDNYLLRHYLWDTILNTSSYYFSPYLILFFIAALIGIYVVCTVLDIIRRLTIEKVWMWIVDNKLNWIPPWFIAKFRVFEKWCHSYLK